MGTVTSDANLKRMLLKSIAKIAMRSWRDVSLITVTKARNYTHRTFSKTRPKLKNQMPVNEIGPHGLRTLRYNLKLQHNLKTDEIRAHFQVQPGSLNSRNKGQIPKKATRKVQLKQ
jgi:hypothetical protein